MKTFFAALTLVTSISAYAIFDENDLTALIAESQKRDSDVLMVWKDGQLLHSYNRYPDKLYSVQSVTKSMTALTASCILRGHMEELDSDHLFKEWEGTPHASITLRMLLSMSSGIVDPKNYWASRDYYAYTPTLPLTTAPGSTFSYSNASIQLAGKWIKEKTGQQFSAHLKRCFFDPMGITKWRVGRDIKGNDVTAGGLHVEAEGFIKMGILLLQNGEFEGQALLDPEQVQGLLQDAIPTDKTNYGLSFWKWGKDVYFAEGYLGQFLIIVPKEKLVVLKFRNPEGMRDTPENQANWFQDLPGFIVKLIKD